MSDSAFWLFSLQFYSSPGVSDACLDLQDRFGADVNVVLYLLFLAAQGRVVTGDDVERIDASVRAWRAEVVAPLRSVRRALRRAVAGFDPDLAQALRRDVKRIELEAERMQQVTLERIVPATGVGATTSPGGTAGRTNLAAYVAYLGGVPDELIAPLLEAFDAARATSR